MADLVKDDEVDAYTRALRNVTPGTLMAAIPDAISAMGKPEAPVPEPAPYTRPPPSFGPPADWRGLVSSTPTPRDDGRMNQVPSETGTFYGTVGVDKTAQEPRVQQGRIGGYGNEGRAAVLPLPGSGRLGVGNAVAGYGGLDEGAGFALARQAAAGSPPQGLPPGVTQLRMDVPADGPKHLLGPGWNENASQMPSVVNPAANSDRAWGNASGQGPVVRTMGNGITREAELRILHQGGPLAVLAANQAADMMPLQRGALAANTEKTQAETNKILQDPGFEGRRVGAIEQEMQNRLALGQGEIGAKYADIASKEKLGLGGLGLEQQKVDQSGRMVNVDIKGKELSNMKQQELIDAGKQLFAATTPEEVSRLQQSIGALLGHPPGSGVQIHPITEKTKDSLGNETQTVTGFGMYVPGQGYQQVAVGPQKPAQKYTDGELRQDPDSKKIFKYDAKSNKWVPR